MIENKSKIYVSEKRITSCTSKKINSKKFSMLYAEVEAEIAKLVSDGGLKQETLARRRRVRASFQALTVQH